MKINNCLFYILFILGVYACSDDDEQGGYEIPETYDFEHVDYSGQLERISMLSEMKSYMSTGNAGNEIDANKLKGMFENSADAGFTRSYEKQIKDKTFEQEREKFETWMEYMEQASKNGTSASEGVAGVISSNDGAKSYLVGEKGVEYAQLIEKGLMGACFYYQGTSVYLGEDRMNADNEIVNPGRGTDMEHHWDESFGYLGVPIDFPANTDGVIFWGDYCNDRDALINSNDRIMKAYLEGRAAISNRDLEARDLAIGIIRDTWEEVSAATGVHYLNSAIASYEDKAIRFHALSEAIAFIYSLKFNSDKSVSNDQIDAWISEFSGSSIVEEMDLYNVTVENLQNAKEDISSAFGLDDIKDEL